MVLVMHEMNLLPVWVLRKQRRRKVWIWVTVMEAVIFLLTTGIIVGCRIQVQALRERLDVLEARLNDPRYDEAEGLADAVKSAEAAADAERDILAALPLTRFDSRWLIAALRTMPDDAAFVALEIADAKITLTAETPDLRQAEHHRAALAETGLFSMARYGMTSLREDGFYRYSLIMEADE